MTSATFERVQARNRLADKGVTMRWDSWLEEYRVNFRYGREATAYYTTDLDDAVATGNRMAKEGAPAA